MPIEVEVGMEDTIVKSLAEIMNWRMNIGVKMVQLKT